MKKTSAYIARIVEAAHQYGHGYITKEQMTMANSATLTSAQENGIHPREIALPAARLILAMAVPPPDKQQGE